MKFYRGSTDPIGDCCLKEDTLMTEDGYARPSERPGMGIVLNDRAPLIAEADLVLLEGESVGPFLGEAVG